MVERVDGDHRLYFVFHHVVVYLIITVMEFRTVPTGMRNRGMKSSRLEKMRVVL